MKRLKALLEKIKMPNLRGMSDDDLGSEYAWWYKRQDPNWNEPSAGEVTAAIEKEVARRKKKLVPPRSQGSITFGTWKVK